MTRHTPSSGHGFLEVPPSAATFTRKTKWPLAPEESLCIGAGTFVYCRLKITSRDY